MSNKIVLFCIYIFIIVYIVLKIYKIPKSEVKKIENFTTHSKSNEITEETNLDKEEVDKFLENLKKKDELFLKQEEKQNLQNRDISLIKQRVSDLRNDLLVMRNNEKSQIESLTKKNLDNDEDFGDISGGSSDITNSNSNSNNNFGSISGSEKGKEKKLGKSYNLNFNLD